MDKTKHRKGKSDSKEFGAKLPLKAHRRQISQSELANRRIGATPEERLRWVISFARKDLDVLRPEERVALGHDLQELIPKREVLEGPPPPIQEVIVRKIHAEIAKRLKGLLADPPEPWKLPARDGLLWRVDSDEPFRFTGEGSEVEGIFWGVINLLLEAGTHLQACPVCSKPFVARKRQGYCSTGCAQRERDKRKKKRKQS